MLWLRFTGTEQGTSYFVPVFLNTDFVLETSDKKFLIRHELPLVSQDSMWAILELKVLSKSLSTFSIPLHCFLIFKKVDNYHNNAVNKLPQETLQKCENCQYLNFNPPRKIIF